MNKLFLIFIVSVLSLAIGNVAYAQKKDKAQEIDSIATHWAGLVKFNGSILVTQDGQLLMNKGYGIREVGQGSTVGETTLYMIGGVTEIFTAALVFKLQELGKLSINDTLSKYLPDFPKAKEIQIKHLLAHQTGLYDYLKHDSLYNFSYGGAVSDSIIYALFKDTTAAFNVGDSTMASASDYFLLGKIIEQAADTNYFAALRQHILTPLKIKNTGFNINGFSSWDKAQGYSILNKARVIPAFYDDSTVNYASAGLFTSTTGINKLVNAMFEDKLLNKSSWSAMYADSNSTYGWTNANTFGKKTLRAKGEVPGFVSSLDVIPENKTVLIILSNNYEDEVYKLRDNIMAALHNKPYKLPVARRSVIYPRHVLEWYEGGYEFEDGTNLQVYIKDNLLWGKEIGGSEFTMLADIEQNVFFLASSNVEFYFIRDKKTNLVTDLVVRRNRKERVAHKWQ